MTAEEHPETKNRFEIVVNGRLDVWNDDRISYEEVVKLAFQDTPPDTLFTVTYTEPNGRAGSLTRGQSTAIEDRMSFNVVKTNRS